MQEGWRGKIGCWVCLHPREESLDSVTRMNHKNISYDATTIRYIFEDVLHSCGYILVCKLLAKIIP